MPSLALHIHKSYACTQNLDGHLAMSYTFNHDWRIHRLPTSSHMINCARCQRHEPEAGIIEGHMVMGSGYWKVCERCAQHFLRFIKEEPRMTIIDQDFEDAANMNFDDIDIAEHHATCRCYECVVDPDQYRKYELENDVPSIEVRRSA